MGFNNDAFMGQQFEARTEDVAVPELAAWFDGDPVWQVRCLTADEFFKAQQAGARRDNTKAFVDALTKGSKQAKQNEFLKVFGIDSDPAAETVIRHEMLAFGSVEPTCDITLAVKLANVHGVLFKKLTDKILELSGQGQIEQGKQKPATAIQKSKARSN